MQIKALRTATLARNTNLTLYACIRRMDNRKFDQRFAGYGLRQIMLFRAMPRIHGRWAPGGLILTTHFALRWETA